MFQVQLQCLDEERARELATALGAMAEAQANLALSLTTQAAHLSAVAKKIASKDGLFFVLLSKSRMLAASGIDADLELFAAEAVRRDGAAEQNMVSMINGCCVASGHVENVSVLCYLGRYIPSRCLWESCRTFACFL
jgi:hypothetical protein